MSVASKPIGRWIESGNISFAVIYNASHMSSIDSPEGTLAVINNLMGLKEPLISFEKVDTN